MQARRVEQIVGYAFIAGWALLPLLAGPALGDALHDVATPLRTTASVGLWVAWAVALVASLVPLPLTLVIVRVIAPAALAVAIWAAATDGLSAATAAALAATAVLTVVVLSAPIGGRFVDGASYGDERRMPLRPPAALYLGALPLAWAVTVAGLTVGPLLLGDQRWVVGVIATAIGCGLAFLAARALFQLAQRFVVFVPAGMVLHDYSTLTEPVLFRRASTRFVGPALADSSARDLSHGASGLLLELNAPGSKIGAREGGNAELVSVDAVLFAPSRPGALLAEAERRRLPVL